MLTDGPASGYDMKKCFESSFGHFFPAGYGSIYPALATLARNGLVEFEEVPQEGKPDRKVAAAICADVVQENKARATAFWRDTAENKSWSVCGE